MERSFFAEAKEARATTNAKARKSLHMTRMASPEQSGERLASRRRCVECWYGDAECSVSFNRGSGGERERERERERGRERERVRDGEGG